MAHDDLHSQSFNLSSSIGSTTRIPILFINDYEVWALHFEDYVLGIEEHGSTIWQAITVETFAHTTTMKVIKTLKEYNDLLVAHTDIPHDEKNKLDEIWDRLQELYSGDADLEHSVQTTILSEFGLFSQASDETLTQTFNYYNHLLSRLLKYKIARSVIEQKFKSYTLVKVMGILKSHEKEITSEAKTTTSLGSLALVAKGKNANDDDSESDFSDEELTSKDKALRVSNPKKFFKRISPYSRIAVDKEISIPKSPRRMNHFVKDCLLRKQNEKKEQVKDEEYYAKKIADLKKDDASTAKSAFMVQEDSEYGVVEVWSTDSDDDEVRKPTHGRCFVVKGRQLRTQGVLHRRMPDVSELFSLRNLFRNRGLHKMILPFLELKEEEIDAECYKCETIVSSDEVSEAYRIGLDKIENYIQSKEHENMMKDEMSKISVEDEVDCSAFVNNQSETKKNLISENSVAFARIVENKGSQALNEQTTVFPKIKTVLNQVFVKPGLNLKDTSELKVLVDNDNSDGCDAFFWSEPIDNLDETKGLSEMTSWKSRGKYISGSLNRKDSFYHPGTSGTKPIQNTPFVAYNTMPTKLPSSVPRIHKSPEELKARRKQMNARPNPKSQHSSKHPTKQVFQKPHTFISLAENFKTSEPTKTKILKPVLKSNELKGKAKLYPEPEQTPVFKDVKITKVQKHFYSDPKPTFRSTKFTKVMRDKQYDPEWYIDSGSSRHMTGRKEELREYRSLRNGGKIRYGNNVTGEIKGYGMITNGELSIRKVAYVEGLQHNLISVSQLVVGTGLKVSFDEDGSELIERKTNKIILKSKRKGEMFPLDMKPIKGKPAICLLTKAANDDSWLWHRRLSHMNFRDINKLVLGDLVRGLPLLKYDKDRLCDACELGKQRRKGHSTIINTKIIEPLELLHIDLCGPSAIESVAHNKYILVVVDDFSRFTWVFFLKHKYEATPNMINFIKQVEVLLRKQVRMIRSDNGREFKNQVLEDFLVSKGITHNFSAPYTPQQNGVVERRNQSLYEAARTMLSFARLPFYFWADAIAIACFTQNRSTSGSYTLPTKFSIRKNRM
ncbi:hypothetical protein L1887_17545 [Cichorium endivia]|nr:hypothetical protein L1887_17545 [Cichorium endivia]